MRRRGGFTLIELLVVLGIITVLATLVVAVAPRFGDRQRASRGASMLQSWLNLAKQRALRDRRPVGIRLPHQDSALSATTPGYISGYVTEVQYIELPDERIAGTIQVPFDYLPDNQVPPPKPPFPYPSAATEYQFIGLKTTVPFDPTLPTAPLQAGDVISFTDRPMANYAHRRIVSVQTPPNGSPVPVSKGIYYFYLIQLDQPLPPTSFATESYLVSRKARPVVGEQVLQLPKDIAIDITNNGTPTSAPTWYRMYPPTANTGGTSPFDILFSPSGQVIGTEGNLGSRICLWVRDVSLNDPDPPAGQAAIFAPGSQYTDPRKLPPGYNALITVYTRTGHVTSHPINPDGLLPNTMQIPNQWNPFKFTQDGLTSGNAGN
jgi:prepilin-type N-terminal cleavage/methylation domain-containing protein